MKIYSVSSLTREIKSLLEGSFREIWLEGEISNFRPAASGHLYFGLKDASSQIRAVMFRGSAATLRFAPEDGLAVLCRGRVAVYEPRGEYQIILEEMEPKGVGALQLAFEQLKKKLESEGLFEVSRKKKLPFLPEKIGIITSPTGSVIRDMIHVLTRRFPNVSILLNPVTVQGDKAAGEIAEAIREMNERDDLDLLIIARGGGSIEDLWAFNEEVVARAIAASRLPVISAVGHETDFTIADFVADLRAPTPSAAAELAIPVKEDLLYTLREHRHRLYQAMEQKVETSRLLLRQWEGYFRDPARKLSEYFLRIDHLREKSFSLLEHRMSLAREKLSRLKTHVQALSPLAILERGYAIVSRHGDSVPLRNVAKVSPGDQVDIRLASGALLTQVLKKH
jgi:exodeoxyribonuclease VII large subunit